MKIIGLIILSALLFTTDSIAQISNQTTSFFQTTVLPKGDRAPESNFTGVVWLNPLVSDSLAYWSMAKVSFEPGAYSKWHTHTGTQTLIIQEGTGYLKEKGKPIHVLKKGDVIIVQPGVKHWHGATPQSGFVQLVVNSETQKGVVTWLERVTEEEYRSGK